MHYNHDSKYFQILYFLQDFKYGGTPLHWAKTSEILEALLEAGCLINARNFQVPLIYVTSFSVYYTEINCEYTQNGNIHSTELVVYAAKPSITVFLGTRVGEDRI